MPGFFNKYPYTDFHELNLDYVLEAIKLLKEQMETFTSTNTITYADPIEWNITSQYGTNTIVLNAASQYAYISKKPVTSGILITDTEYWLPVLDLSGLLSGLDYVTPKMFGAKGDGITDDTAAIQNMKTFCINNDKIGFIPNDVYYIPNGINLWGMRYLYSIGKLTTDNASDVIEIGVNATTAVYANIYIAETNGTVKIHGAIASDIHVGHCYHLYLSADSTAGDGGIYHTISYNRFSFEAIAVLTLKCETNGGVLSWMNENSFDCGRILNEINFLGDYKMNDNVFYSPRIENVTVNFEIGQNNYFYNCRLEGTPSFTFDSTCFNNTFFCIYSNFIFTTYAGAPSSAYTVTDNGYNNGVVQIQDTFTEYEKVFSLNPVSQNYHTAVFQSDEQKLTINLGYQPFFDTGLVALDEIFGFNFNSDAQLFNLRVEAYDATGTLITSDPVMTQGNLRWVPAYTAYAIGQGVADINTNFILHPTTGVAFFRLYITTAGGTVGQSFKYANLTMRRKKNNASIKLNNIINTSGGYYGIAAPVTGTFRAGDIVRNSGPASGEPVGWICTVSGTPGTWAGYGTIS